MKAQYPIACLALLALAAGCTNTRWGFLNRDHSNERPVQGAPPPKESVVAYLNENASRIQSMRCDDLHITLHQGLVPIGLSGHMMTEKPRNFRMSGELASSQIVDLGSNGQEFWWWISKDNPPDQYFCSYKDLEEGKVRALPFPFQPEWIMETIGIGSYGPADRYEMSHDDYTLKLTERIRSPLGRPVRKVIVMRRAEQKAPSAQVTEFLLLDDTSGKELCSAHVLEVQVIKGAVVPRRLELRWPDAKARLEMRFDNVALNTALPQSAFIRKNMPGVQSRDLAQLFGGGSVQRASGLNP